MSEHTPGPWTIEQYGDDETPALVIHKDSESRICFMATPGSFGDPAKIEADAHLIAAAPDMLKALIAARDAFMDGERDATVDQEVHAHQLVTHAIAKAEGKDTAQKSSYRD